MRALRGAVIGLLHVPPTLSALHATSAVNYFCHRGTNRRYETGEGSTNNAVLGILVLGEGEGWHNNHHRCPGAARAGFFWSEFDPIYYLLKVLAWLGIAWDLHEVPEEVRHAP